MSHGLADAADVHHPALVLCERIKCDIVTAHWKSKKKISVQEMSFTHYGFQFLNPYLVLSPELPGLSAAAWTKKMESEILLPLNVSVIA